jgi:DNA mismatch endonuclease (patch repair protein)
MKYQAREKLISPPPSSPAVSAVMRGNKRRDTRPELIVRKLLFSLGYRYRVTSRDLPGRPDVVFRGRKKAIFVHGCFWHQHRSRLCPFRSHPQTNLDYWKVKFQRNVARDKTVKAALHSRGWKIEIIWECETRNPEALKRRVVHFLGARCYSVAPRNLRPDSRREPRRRGLERRLGGRVARQGEVRGPVFIHGLSNRRGG